VHTLTRVLPAVSVLQDDYSNNFWPGVVEGVTLYLHDNRYMGVLVFMWEIGCVTPGRCIHRDNEHPSWDANAILCQTPSQVCLAAPLAAYAHHSLHITSLLSCRGRTRLAPFLRAANKLFLTTASHQEKYLSDVVSWPYWKEACT
jgi:hypothetical protein